MASIEALSSFRSACKANIAEAQTRQKQQYDAKHQPPSFRVGDDVWYRNRRRDTRKGGKLESVWAGKTTVEEVLSKGKYRLKGLKRMYNAVNLKCVTTDIQPTSGPSAPSSDSIASTCTQGKASDACLTKVTEAPVQHIFVPPDIQWQRDTCQKENLPFVAKSGPVGQVCNKPFNAFTDTTRTRSIGGGGNCFLRAISFIITGSEDNHPEVRQLLCQHMESSLLQFNGKSGGDYVRSSKMNHLGVWGTNDECQAVADWLKTPVFVRCLFGSRMSWQMHSPCGAELKSSFGLYLDNTSGCQYNVVLSVGRK